MDAGAKTRTYKIGQAAKLLDVKPFVLRFWEGEFKDVLVPVRTPAGQRAYTESNVSTVREIKRLLYEEGLTIEGAKKRLGQPQGKAPLAAPQHSAAPTGTSALPLLDVGPGASAGATGSVAAGSLAGSLVGSPGGSPADSYVGSASGAPAGVSAEALAAAESAAAKALAQAEAARAATRAETARADAASAEAQRAAHRSTALATTLEDVARELKAIRDLLT